MINRIALLAFLVATTSACTSASLYVTNNSDFSITEMHVTDVNNPSWGANLIAGDVLMPGEQVRIDTTCSTYDVLLVDEQGVSCEIDSIDLCANSADFVITNSTCVAFRKAAAEQKALQSAPTAK